MVYLLFMEPVSQSILLFLETVPTVTQVLLIGFFSFSEGLPVIGSILPGGTIAILAGSLSAGSVLGSFGTAALVSFASFLGDMVGFAFVKKYRHLPWIQKMVTHEKHQKSWDLFDRHLALIIIFGKLIPVVRSTPSLFAAMRGTKTRRYAAYSFTGSLLWGMAGVYGGSLLSAFFGKNVSVFILALIAVSIVGVVVHQGYQYLRGRKP